MAGFISKETIELVNSTTDIISLVGDYTKLERRTGNDWWGCCPFHNEKSASFDFGCIFERLCRRNG